MLVIRYEETNDNISGILNTNSIPSTVNILGLIKNTLRHTLLSNIIHDFLLLDLTAAGTEKVPRERSGKLAWTSLRSSLNRVLEGFCLLEMNENISKDQDNQIKSTYYLLIN